MNNIIDFICYSNGDSATGATLSMQSTADESYKLGYVYAGSGAVTIDEKEYRVYKGSSFLVFPYTSFSLSPNSDMRYKWIEISGLAAAASASRIALCKSRPVVHDMGIEGFERYFELPDSSDELSLFFRRGGMLIILFSYYYEKYPGKSADGSGYVLKARSIIEERYTDHTFGVKEVAEQLKIDRSHLYRLFKDEMGVSVIDYICRRRILRAEMMLSKASLSVKDVAFSSGFSDQLYFSRMFKKLNGKTPTQFREALLGKNRVSASDTPTKP